MKDIIENLYRHLETPESTRTWENLPIGRFLESEEESNVVRLCTSVDSRTMRVISFGRAKSPEHTILACSMNQLERMKSELRLLLVNDNTRPYSTSTREE